MPRYIHQITQWPNFTWNEGEILPLLSEIKYKQGALQAHVQYLGFEVKNETSLQTLTLDVLKTSEIEGEFLKQDQVRSSIARHLGMDIVGLVPSDRHTDGVVEMMLDATKNHHQALTKKRLCNWHAALFPTGRSGMHPITVGNWRKNDKGPMQVVSVAMGKERVHYEAPDADTITHEMTLFLKWFNAKQELDAVIKSAVAHFWFITIHPFDDGNGRIARAIADMQLANADEVSQRFYSMSAQIKVERKGYYDMLEKRQKGSLEITEWILWYLSCLTRALDKTNDVLQQTLSKARFWEQHTYTSINERQRLLINKLFDGFDGKLNSSKWAKIAKCSADTALRDINDLIQKNILVKEASGGRSTSYVLKEVL